VDFVGHVRELPGEDKHRTEVTEATEGGFWVTKAPQWTSLVTCENYPGRISIAQRSQRPQRGILGDESSSIRPRLPGEGSLGTPPRASRT
jgi:hypothetical protein